MGGGTGMTEDNCSDGIDNDGDEFIDCADFDCEGTPECPLDTENSDALCSDGMDNDGDGLTDCADDSCHGHPNVAACKESVCDDGMDDDEDGRVDCEDRDCQLAAGPGTPCYDDPNDGIESGPGECSDNVDNDTGMNGFIDCQDFACQNTVPSCAENTAAACMDNVDNNNNTFTDCADFTCQYDAGGVCPETGDAECSDGISNNDGDDFIDCQDFSCQRSNAVTVCEGNAVTCADGVDNDGNGFTDCEDFACRNCEGNSTYVAPTCLPCP